MKPAAVSSHCLSASELTCKYMKVCSAAASSPEGCSTDRGVMTPDPGGALGCDMPEASADGALPWSDASAQQRQRIKVCCRLACPMLCIRSMCRSLTSACQAHDSLKWQVLGDCRASRLNRCRSLPLHPESRKKS